MMRNGSTSAPRLTPASGAEGGVRGGRTRSMPGTAARLLLPRLAYGALFTVVLPLALALWAARLDRLVRLPALDVPVAGAIVAALGVVLMASAMAALWIHGRGLPMSPYPPDQFVSRGPYRYLRHPIYLGAVLVSSGVSLWFRSGAGLWIVSPLVAAMAAAWVMGFERDATRAHFGAAMRVPLLALPPATDDGPTARDRASALVLVFVPWAVLYQAVELLGVPRDAVVVWQAWEWRLPVLAWTEAVYALAYPFVVLAPLAARTRRDVRWLMTRGWLAMAVILPIYLLLPLVAPAKAVTGSGVLETMMRWERAYDRPVTAFPSFHVVWVLLAARTYRRRWPRLAWLWWGVAGAIAASCLTTGMHAIADVLAGVVVYAAIARAERIWERVRRWTERLANSWHEAVLGPMRFMSHGVYAAAGVWAGVLVATFLAGGHAGTMLAITAASIVGAALWAQVIEGSSQLLRPYGYYGGVIGGLAGVLVAWAFGAHVWPIAAAFAIGGSLTQAIGRCRCLVQGCCHGAECPAWLGIRYSHPRSRVTRLSTLGNRPVHPTQLYSMVWMLVVAAALARLWMLRAGLQFIVGSYFILTGLGRFVEEHYRGEPQTMVWRGFRLYQWLSIAFVPLGAGVTCIGWTPAPAPAPLSMSEIAGITAFGVLTYLAYGADFPRLSARFSRLV